MSSQKKSRKGSGKVKNLEPRKLAKGKGENVKGGATSSVSKASDDSRSAIIANLRG